MIAIGTTYYNNPENLKNFVKAHLEHFDHMYIVDDGSSDPASNHIKEHPRITLYRVKKDYGFNSHGCRNLIMKETQIDWNILIDIDRIFIDPGFTANTIKRKKLNINTLYTFEVFAKNNKPDSIHESVNDFLVNKSHFWKAGGYDEEVVGIRYGDREYRAQLRHFGKEQLISGIQISITRIPSVYLNLCSTKDKLLTQEIYDLICRRMITPEPNKKTLTFEWEKIF